MKLLSFPFLLGLIIAANGCNKEKNDGPVAKTTEQLLTENTWKADEIRIQMSNNSSSYYKRNSAGTTYDSDSLKFAGNGTGNYYFLGSTYSTTWSFTDAAKTKMTIIINQPPAPITIYLENIQLAESFFKYAQYSSAGGISYLASCTRVPN